MSEVKRYDMSGYGDGMIEVTEGAFVYFEDHQSELSAMREELDKLGDDYCKRIDELTAAEQRNAELVELLSECTTEMTLAITDYETRSAMTVVGRTRFMEVLKKYNDKPTESGASE